MFTLQRVRFIEKIAVCTCIHRNLNFCYSSLINSLSTIYYVHTYTRIARYDIIAIREHIIKSTCDENANH